MAQIQVPQSVDLAYKQLLAGFKAIGMPELDPLKASWADIEKGVARLLGGPLNLEKREHQAVALGVSAVLGLKLATQDGAFWAQNRESPDGLIMGFADAIVMLSPFGAAMDALSKSNLPQLETVQTEIRTALGRARLSISAGRQAKLTQEDYERLFDPAFIQFVLLDDAKLKDAWENPVAGLTRNLRESLDRAQLPPELKKQMDAQLLGSIASLEQQKPLMTQLAVAGRLVELVGHLAATTEATPPAPEDFWAAVALPLLFIGAPTAFPPLGEEEQGALDQGIDPLFLYLDVVPYSSPAADDEGLLGAFGGEDVGLLHPSLAGLSPLRLLSLKLDRIGPALEKFKPDEAKAAFARFCDYVKAQTGKPVESKQSEQVMGEAFMVLGAMKKVWDARGKGKPALRRLTEAEAASDSALGLVRKALNGPRIILA